MSIFTPTAPAVKPAADAFQAFLAELPVEPDYLHLWELEVLRYLHGRGYHHTIAARILAHVGEHGSVECCALLSFDDRDRAAVEKLLPVAPPCAWARYDSEVFWTIGPEA